MPGDAMFTGHWGVYRQTVSRADRMVLHRGLEDHAVSFFSVLIQLVEVQITVGIFRCLIHLRHEVWYSSGVGNLPSREATAASSAEAR